MYSRNNIFGNCNQRIDIQKRTRIVMIIFTLLFCFLIWKIAKHMYFESEPLKAMFNSQYTIDEKYGMPYNLLDHNGVNLLHYEKNFYAVIDPVDYFRFNEYTSKYDMKALTITLRNYNNDYDLEKIKKNGNGEKVKYKIDEATFNKLMDIKGVKGFYAYEANDVIKDNKYWKIENLLINTTYNKKDVDLPVSKSADSLEMQIYNKTKNNEFTKTRFDKGVNGEISDGKIINPENNVNVRLTIDKKTQDKVEDILHNEKYSNYAQIGVVLMESSTGKIRAMAQKDDNLYNANLGMTGTNGAYPGSIFKVIVDEAGIDLNLIDINKKYTLDPNIFKEERYKGKDQYTVREALAYSSNNIFGQFGLIVGLENMYDYAEKQGMLSKVLNLHHEENVKVDSLNRDEIMLSAIGQKVRITPLQALSIPNTIINNGIHVQPSIIDAYINDNNQILEEIAPETSRVLKQETAEIVKLHMMDVVNKGTGTQAYIKDMDIGGKTGTTEYFDGGKEKSDGWFVGFFNLQGKNYSMVVFVPDIYVKQKLDKTNTKLDEDGGTTAAPIFKEIVNAIKDMD